MLLFPDLQERPIELDYRIHWNKKLGSGISGPVRYVFVCVLAVLDSRLNTGDFYLPDVDGHSCACFVC